MAIRKASGLFLAKYTVCDAPQPRARMVMCPGPDLDEDSLKTIIRTLAADASTGENEIHLTSIEKVNDVLEWFEDAPVETTKTPAPAKVSPKK